MESSKSAFSRSKVVRKKEPLTKQTTEQKFTIKSTRQEITSHRPFNEVVKLHEEEEKEHDESSDGNELSESREKHVKVEVKRSVTEDMESNVIQRKITQKQLTQYLTKRNIY